MLRSTFGSCYIRLTYRKLAGASFGVLGLLALAPLASAQSDFNRERFEISPFAGATIYHQVRDGVGSKFDTGPLLGGRVTENLTDHFALEQSFGWNRNALELLAPSQGGSSFKPKFEDRTINFNADLVYHLTPLGSRFRPFFDVGYGGVHFNPNGEAKTYYLQNFATPANPSLHSVTRGQYNFGGGLKVRLNNWFGVRFDYREVLSRNPTLGMPTIPTSSGVYLPNNNWLWGGEATGGLVFYIGGKPAEADKITVTPIMATPSQGDAGLTASNPAATGIGFRLTENAHDNLGHTLNYRWTVNGMPVGENSNTIMYTPSAPGQYKVEVTVSDATPKHPAASASPDPLTLYVAEHRITIGAITITPLQGNAGLTAATPAADGSGFRFSVNAQDSLGHPLTYRWTVDGNVIPGNTNSTTFTENQPGQHNVGAQATDGTLTATATGASFYTRDQRAPRPTCNATPDSVGVGQTVTLSVVPNVAAGSSARVRWTVSEGTLANPNAAQTTLDTSSVSFPAGGQVQTKTITATATVTDDFGGSGSCTSTIRVSSNPQTTHYGDIVFGEGSARINNCAKRILINRVYPELTGSYQGYTLVLVGHIDPSERANRTLDRRRVMNAAAILTAGKGPQGKDTCMALEPSRITADWVGTADTEYKETPCSVSFEPAPEERPADRVNPGDARAKNRRVEIWLVPPGKSLPSSVKEAHTITAQDLKQLACPK